MGEFRDMGIPAQVVKKKSCTSGEAASFAASAGFFFATVGAKNSWGSLLNLTFGLDMQARSLDPQAR
jgi:hypothetical protein